MALLGIDGPDGGSGGAAAHVALLEKITRWNQLLGHPGPSWA